MSEDEPKTYNYCEKNGNAVLTFDMCGGEEKAYEVLKELVKNPREWRLEFAEDY